MPNRAVERLCAKLEGVRGTGEAVEIGEMFRHLTLQVRFESITCGVIAYVHTAWVYFM